MADSGALEDKYELGLKTTLMDHIESCAARAMACIGPVPRHIAFCMDGNRRYAKKYHLQEGAGHVGGFETMLRLLLASYRLGIKTVTVYAFSIENFNRSREESEILFDLVRHRLWLMVQDRESAMRRLGWHIRFPGRREMLADDLIERLNEIERLTSGCNGMVVNICAPYTTRDDLAHALSQVATLAPDQLMPNETYAMKLDHARYMASNDSLDIFVRTSGETRFSDFMCWEATAGCTFEFVPQLWPEFTVWHLYRVIAKWQARKLIEQQKNRSMIPIQCLAIAPPLVSVSKPVRDQSRAALPTQAMSAEKPRCFNECGSQVTGSAPPEPSKSAPEASAALPYALSRETHQSIDETDSNRFTSTASSLQNAMHGSTENDEVARVPRARVSTYEEPQLADKLADKVNGTANDTIDSAIEPKIMLESATEGPAVV